MNKKTILTLFIPVAILVVVITAFKSGWIMQSANAPTEDLINRSALQGIANGMAEAGILPPESGYEEFPQENRGSVRLQYVNGKQSVVSPGKDNEFETEHDIVIHYQINKTANTPSCPPADNRADVSAKGS